MFPSTYAEGFLLLFIILKNHDTGIQVDLMHTILKTKKWLRLTYTKYIKVLSNQLILMPYRFLLYSEKLLKQTHGCTMKVRLMPNEVTLTTSKKRSIFFTITGILSNVLLAIKTVC